MNKILAGCVLLALPSLLGAQLPSGKDYLEMGKALYKQGLYDKAVDCFQQAVQVDPDNAQFMFSMVFYTYWPGLSQALFLLPYPR